MPKVVPPILTAVGAFLLVCALLAQFYATPAVLKTPLDVESVTSLSGDAALADGTGGTNDLVVAATSITLADSEKSDDEVISWLNSSCLVKVVDGSTECVAADDPSEALLSATTDGFATDRNTGIAVNDAKYLPAGAGEREGLVNKWPFKSEKKTYPYWDGSVGEAVDAEYDRTEDVEGLETYVYKITVPETPTEDGTYASEREIFVEPLTGAILNQTEHRVQANEDGETQLELNLAFTEDEVKESADDASTNRLKLNLITFIVPVVGYVLGIPLLLLGLFLMFRGRRGDGVERPKRRSA